VVEQRPFKPKVVGSIPTAPTNLQHLQHFIGVFDTNKAFDTNWTTLLRTLRSARTDSLPRHAVGRPPHVHKPQG
jgi:hypothetical protein